MKYLEDNMHLLFCQTTRNHLLKFIWISIKCHIVYFIRKKVYGRKGGLGFIHQ
jgi:hypothetical protein